MPHNLLYDSLYSSDGLWMSTLNLIFLPRSSNLPWFYQAGNLVLIDSSFCFLLPFSHQIPSILFYKASCLSLSIPTAIKLFGALMTSCHHCLHSLLKVPASGCFPIPCIHSASLVFVIELVGTSYSSQESLLIAPPEKIIQLWPKHFQ